MSQVQCPRCQRVQPAGARFCHFDGAELQAPAGLPVAFVFPSGRRCQSFDELARGCVEEWDEARALLQQGALQSYLSGIGRHDLARSAAEAVRLDDADLAVDQFLRGLPTTARPAPHLDVVPRRLLLGTISAGAASTVKVTVRNQGAGMLIGTLSVVEGDSWLVPQAGPDSAIKTTREQEIILDVDTSGLTPPSRYIGRLRLITNGGVAEVSVQLDLEPAPLPCRAFQGVRQPRELAELMRADPESAAALLEDGTISEWFTRNGWNYPVSGPSAEGVAAVQQFLEALGMARPPVVELSEALVECTCIYPESQPGQVLLQTAEESWVYAFAESEALWLRLASTRVSGWRQATLAFEIDASLLEPGAVYEGDVTIVTNGGRMQALRVRADVLRAHASFTERLLRPFRS